MSKITKIFRKTNEQGETTLRIQVEDTVVRKNNSALSLLNKGDSRFSGNTRKAFSIISKESLESLTFDNGKKLSQTQLDKIMEFAENGEIGLENGYEIELNDVKIDGLFLRVRVQESLTPFNEYQEDNIEKVVKKIKKTEDLAKSNVAMHESVKTAEDGEWCIFLAKIGKNSLRPIFTTNELVVSEKIDEPVKHTFIEEVLEELGISQKPVLFAESFLEEQGIALEDLVAAELTINKEIASEKATGEKITAKVEEEETV